MRTGPKKKIPQPLMPANAEYKGGNTGQKTRTREKNLPKGPQKTNPKKEKPPPPQNQLRGEKK